MRTSKHQKINKTDIPMPENAMTSSPPQQDNKKSESSIKYCQASVEEVRDKDNVPELIDDGENDEMNDKANHEKLALTAAAAVYTVFAETNISGKDPKSLKEVMSLPDWPEWEKAIQIELEMLRHMDTWELVDTSNNRKPITNKWVFVRKYDKDGMLQKYKAHLVARGFSQIPGMDYNETFSPVVCLKTIHAILALAVAKDWEIQQMDVKGAYLNRKLKEDIYMDQLQGYNDGMSRVCHLIKTLYGLKQSGREWNEELDSKLSGIKFQRLYTDACVYI